MKKMIVLYTVLFFLFFGIASSFGQNVSEEARRHFDRGVAAVEMKDFEAAIKEFEQAAKLAPDWPDIFYNLGLAQEGVEKYNDAVRSYKQYLQLAPNASDAEAVKSLINKLEYKAENVLTVADIIDVLVSFSNTYQWEKVGGECIGQPFAFIRRKDSNSVEFPNLYGLEWGPDMRSFVSRKIEGPLFKMKVNTFCGAGDKAAYCHFQCLNEIEIVSRTHVRIRQHVSGTELSPITPPVKNGTYSCEYRKK